MAAWWRGNVAAKCRSDPHRRIVAQPPACTTTRLINNGCDRSPINSDRIDNVLVPSVHLPFSARPRPRDFKTEMKEMNDAHGH